MKNNVENIKPSTNEMSYRNREKKDALSGIDRCLLMLKVILDSVSRIVLFSAWLYVINDGQFSSMYTLITYYTTFAILIIFNIILNDEKNILSGKYWIGEFKSYL